MHYLSGGKETRSEQKYNKYRDYDLLTCLIAQLALFLSITDYEYTFQRMLRAFPPAATIVTPN